MKWMNPTRTVAGMILGLSAVAVGQATRPATRPSERIFTVKLKHAVTNATNPTLTDIVVAFTNRTAKGIEAASGKLAIYDKSGKLIESVDWIEDETLKPGETQELKDRLELKPPTVELLTKKPESAVLSYVAGTVAYSDGTSDFFGK